MRRKLIYIADTMMFNEKIISQQILFHIPVFLRFVSRKDPLILKY